MPGLSFFAFTERGERKGEQRGSDSGGGSDSGEVPNASSFRLLTPRSSLHQILKPKKQLRILSQKPCPHIPAEFAVSSAIISVLPWRVPSNIVTRDYFCGLRPGTEVERDA
jgi:hypothetical protein